MAKVKPFMFRRSDGMSFRYNGELTVNVHDIYGRNTNCFTLGFPAESHTLSEIVSIMNNWVDWSEE